MGRGRLKADVIVVVVTSVLASVVEAMEVMGAT